MAIKQWQIDREVQNVGKASPFYGRQSGAKRSPAASPRPPSVQSPSAPSVPSGDSVHSRGPFATHPGGYGSPFSSPASQRAGQIVGEAAKALDLVNSVMGMFGVADRRTPSVEAKKLFSGVGRERRPSRSKPSVSANKLFSGIGQMAGDRKPFESNYSLPDSFEPWHVSSGFGNRVHPATGEMSFHRGVDAFPAQDRVGTLIPSVGGGIVKDVMPDWGTGGNTVVVEDPDTGYEYYYKHLSDIMVVPGQRVSFQEPVGRMGNTGRTVGQVEGGAHLDLEIRDAQGNPIDPVSWLAAAVPLKGYEQSYGSGPYNPIDSVPTYAEGGVFR